MKYFRKKKPEQKIYIRSVYAREGEIITCTNGHKIAEFLETVYLGDVQDVNIQIGFWQQDKPEIGSFPVCEKCGAEFYEGQIYHIGDSWRDPLNRLSEDL